MTTKNKKTVALVAMLALMTFSKSARAAVGDIYSLKNDFSTTNNPNVTALGGSWSFRKASDASLLLPTATPIGFVSAPGYDPTGGAGGGVPAIWNGFTSLSTPVPFDPAVVGTHGDLMIRWTSAENGSARVSGYFFRDDRDTAPMRKLGYTLDLNGSPIKSQEALVPSTKYFFDGIVPIAVGDNINLKLLGNFSPGATQPFGGFGGVTATVEIVPEPPTSCLAACILPLLLVLGNRWRRNRDEV